MVGKRKVIPPDKEACLTKRAGLGDSAMSKPCLGRTGCRLIRLVSKCNRQFLGAEDCMCYNTSTCTKSLEERLGGVGKRSSSN